MLNLLLKITISKQLVGKKENSFACLYYKNNVCNYDFKYSIFLLRCMPAPFCPAASAWVRTWSCTPSSLTPSTHCGPTWGWRRLQPEVTSSSWTTLLSSEYSHLKWFRLHGPPNYGCRWEMSRIIARLEVCRHTFSLQCNGEGGAEMRITQSGNDLWHLWNGRLN